MLKIFNKTQGKAGMVGLYATPEKLTLSHIVRTTDTPELLLCEDVMVAGAEGRSAALEKLVREHQLEGIQTCFVLSPMDYKLLLVEAPGVEPDEMAGAVKWKIKDLVGHPIDDMAITVFNVPEGAYRSQTDMVYAVAARKSRIRDIIDLVHGSELELSAIDIPELVMMNLTQACCDDSEGLAFLDLREDGSTLNLSRNGEIYLTRQLSTRVDNQIMNTPDWESIRERLVLEIRRSLEYFQSQMGQALVPKILIAPRSSDADALAQELSRAMAIDVESMNITGFLQCQVEVAPALQQSCMLAIGGAMRQELDKKAQKAQKAPIAQKAKAA